MIKHRLIFVLPTENVTEYRMKTARIIAIANQKGGVGKTTTCVNLAASLASLQKRVLLIDMDPQGNATMGCGIDKFSIEQTVSDVLLGDCRAVDAVLRVEANGSHDGWAVLPANSELTAAEVELLSVDQREQQLKQALQSLPGDYDYILLDCPPSLNILTLNAFVAATSVLVPVQCEYYALEGLSALLRTIEDVQEAVNPQLVIEGLLRTMFDTRNRLGNDVSDQLLQHFGDEVFRTVIPRNVRLAEAPSHGMSVVSYDRSSRGALAYLALAGELVRRNQQNAEANAVPARSDTVITTEQSSQRLTRNEPETSAGPETPVNEPLTEATETIGS